jgi:soluble lytic murein transglycosylase-like protein
MTWPHLLRTAMIAILGTIALALASHARAEGGEAPSVISPDDAEAFARASASADAGDSTVQEETVARKPAKASGKTNGKVASASPDEPQAAVDAGGPAEAIALTLRSRPVDVVRATALKPLIARHALENGLPYELADAIIRLESRYNAGARNGPNVGLTQINVRTAQSLGYQGAAAGLLDAETNLRYGLKYLAQAYKLARGDTCGTILRYQFGHRTQAMTGASRTYCAKVKVITAAAE